MKKDLAFHQNTIIVISVLENLKSFLVQRGIYGKANTQESTLLEEAVEETAELEDKDLREIVINYLLA